MKKLSAVIHQVDGGQPMMRPARDAGAGAVTQRVLGDALAQLGHGTMASVHFSPRNSGTNVGATAMRQPR